MNMEIRCIRCNKKLGDVEFREGFSIDMKCPRCKTKHNYKVEAPEAQG